MITRAERAANSANKLACEEGRAIARSGGAGKADQKLGSGDPRDDGAGGGVCSHPLDPPGDPAEQGVADHLAVGGIHAVELADGQEKDRRGEA